MQSATSMEAISLLYEPDAQPVIGVSGRTVRFLNLAARNLFGDVQPGTAVRKLLPEHVAQHQASAFFATAKIKGQDYCITLSSMPGLRIFRLERVRRDGAFGHIVAPSDLFSMELGLSSAYFSAMAAAQEDLTFRHHAARLERTADQLRRWVNNVRTLQTLREGGIHPAERIVDCSALLAAILETVQPLLDRRGIRLEFALPESPCPVRMAPEFFETMVLNLMSNAIKSCADGAVIRINLMKGTRTVHLIIHDRGEGFQEGVLIDVFHAYCAGRLPNTDDSHAGYGLPTCFAVAEDLGGAMLIESSRGSGAAVHVILPLCATGKAALRSSDVPPECASPVICRSGLSDALSEEDYMI